uniref:SH3 domain-containing protein n=1 Tax=Rhabditophanes sp. KR3021 TaxID=114890 RepID=A0AC35U743_9BILA
MLYREFNIQIISEETAQQIQGFFRSAALLAMKPSTGVKRNNAVASAEGGNTAHKKSDVNSKEYIAINPSFDSNDNTWSAVYPHLLCTTRQKDTVIDSRISLQTGKRPLFYFHVIGKLYSPSGQIMTVHNLSLPFTIATRRNQDCQVQRMMSSYTATCFWLYGTFTLDGLALNWNDNGIDWSHFKMLYSNYFKLNAEVKRTIIDSDYKVLEGKIKCMECFDQWNRYDYVNNITFKNVLCPHLRYDIGNSNIVKFSVWRGMLELLHLFNDSKTDVITLWEKFIIYGFIDIHDIEFLLSSCDSIILIHLSFVIGSCVCVVVKTGNRIVLLEPLDLKKLQSKGLLEYLKDIVSTENIKYVYTAKGIRDVQSVFKDLKINFQDEHSYENSVKTISSNIAFSGNTEKLSMICFTNLKVAVIPCRPLKLNNNNNFNDSMATYNNYQQPNEYKDQVEKEGPNIIKSYLIEKSEKGDGRIMYKFADTEDFLDIGCLLEYYKNHCLHNVYLTRSYPRKCIENVIALYKFHGERKTDLPFEKEEVFDIIDKPEEGWWLARNVLGNYGYVPSNYVKQYIIGEDINAYILNHPLPFDNKSSGQLSARSSLFSDLKRLSSDSSGNDSSSNFRNGGFVDIEEFTNMKEPILVRVIANRIPNAYDKDALRLQKGQLIKMTKIKPNGMCEGELNNKYGCFPFRNVEITARK